MDDDLLTRDAIEAEIMRCAIAGDVANLAGYIVEGRLPVVSGKFISDLWLQTLSRGAVHPAGIILAAAQIEGPIELGGARIDARLRTPLVGFQAIHCVFTDTIGLSNARTESIYLTDCVLGQENTEEPDSPAINLDGAELVGTLTIEGCTIHGSVSLKNTTIDDDIRLEASTLGGAVICAGAEVRGTLSVLGCTLTGRDDALDAFNASFGGNVLIANTRLNGGMTLSHGRATSLAVFRSVVDPTGAGEGVNLGGLRLDQRLRVRRCRFRCSFTAVDMHLGGAIEIAHTIFGKAQATLSHSFDGSVVRNVYIDHCGFRNLLSFGHADAGRFFRMTHTTIRAPVDEVGLSAPALRAHEIRLADISTRCQVDLSSAIAHSLIVDRFAAVFEPLAENGGSPHAGFVCAGTNLTNEARFSRCAITGGIDARQLSARTVTIESCCLSPAGTDSLALYDARIAEHLAIGPDTKVSGIDASRVAAGSISISDTDIDAVADQWGLNLTGAMVSGIAHVGQVNLKGGIAFPLARFTELRIEGSRIIAGTGAYSAGKGVWASECVIRRQVALGQSDDAETVEIIGQVDLRNAEIGQNVNLNKVDIRPEDGACAQGNCIALDLSDATIKGSVSLASRLFWRQGQPEPHAHIVGALVLSRAAIDVALTIDKGASLAALGSVDDESDATPGEKRHRGYAASARGSRLGELLIADGARINGTVDLRDAQVGLVSDANASAWERAGMAPGQLLIDGMTYTDLDDTGVTSAEMAVDTRIKWLLLQFRGRRATAATFAPQPYNQLSSYFAQNGNERARRRVHVARRNLQRTTGGLGWIERLTESFLSVTSQYGYSPGRAATSAFVLIAIGSLLAHRIVALNGFVPADADKAPAVAFNSLVYAMDVAVPFLDLGQDSGWAIDASRLNLGSHGTAIVAIGEALYRLLGLIILSVTVLTFSGALREKD